jgi:hypothetical protein
VSELLRNGGVRGVAALGRQVSIKRPNGALSVSCQIWYDEASDSLCRFRARLPADELTATDKRKLDHLQATIRHNLDSYGFRSFQPGEISLSRDNFRPLALRTENGETVEKEIKFRGFG